MLFFPRILVTVRELGLVSLGNPFGTGALSPFPLKKTIPAAFEDLVSVWTGKSYYRGGAAVS